jgi:hypothetical protein
MGHLLSFCRTFLPVLYGIFSAFGVGLNAGFWNRTAITLSIQAQTSIGERYG